MLQGLLDHSVDEMSVVQMDTLPNHVILIDARAKKEYDVSHIQHARWVGFDDFELSRVKDLPKEKPVLVYCSVGYRSEKVAEKLKEAGFQHVHNLYGGIFEWKNQGNPVYNASGITDSVHAYDKFWGVWLKAGKKVFD